MDGVEDEEKNKSNNEKVQKFWPHSVAPESTEGLIKQKSNKKGRILFCKRFQSATFMCEKKCSSLVNIETWNKI